MRPTTLTLDGFQSYLEPQTIDLTSINAAAVTGPVGAGKTTLIDAIVFSLYGRVRYAHAKDSVIHTAAKAMTVELDFTAHDAAWRIRRTMKRTKSGSGFNSKAYLYRIDPTTGTETSQGDSSGNVTPTNAAILDLIGLNYEAFRATSLIEQGQSGTFAAADPGTRYDIFANIIDLDRYAAAEEKARAERNDLARKIETAKIKASTLSETLACADTVASDLTAARAAHTAAAQAATTAQDAVTTATKALEAVTEQWHEQKAAKAQYDHDTAAARTGLEHAQYRARAAADALDTARAAVTRTEEQITDWQEQITRLQAQDTATAESLRAQIATATEAITAARAEADDTKARAAATDAATAARTAQQGMDEANTAAEALRTRAQDLQARIGDLTSKRAAALTEHEAERDRLRLLRSAHDHGGGSCYACGQSLDPVLIERMAADLTTRLADITARGKAHAEALGAAERQAADYRAQMDTLAASHRAHQDAYEQARLDAQAAEHKITAAARAADTAKTTEETRTELEARLSAITDGTSEAAERITALRARITETTDTAEDRQRAVTTAEAERTAATEALTAAETAVAEAGTWDGATMDALTTRGEGLRAEHTAAKATAETTTTTLAAAAERVAVLDAEDHRLTTTRTEHKAITATITADEDDLCVLNKTVEALSPSGVPQMVMNAEIEVLNVDLDHQLSTLSEGRMTAELSTTRQTKSGATRNELTLMVTGPDGTRPYETFSGGQKFLADVALHVALSNLLRDRRGAVMQALLVDEGIGALEGEEKDAVVRVIQDLSHSTFDMSLTVTHDADVVAAMPERIEVEMVSGSSLARVS